MWLSCRILPVAIHYSNFLIICDEQLLNVVDKWRCSVYIVYGTKDLDGRHFVIEEDLQSAVAKFFAKQDTVV